jgi:hypothetical protein
MKPLLAKENPYIDGPPVGDRSAFVEREDVYGFVVHAFKKVSLKAFQMNFYQWLWPHCLAASHWY